MGVNALEHVDSIIIIILWPYAANYIVIVLIMRYMNNITTYKAINIKKSCIPVFNISELNCPSSICWIVDDAPKLFLGCLSAWDYLLSNRDKWIRVSPGISIAWWHNQMETFSALMALCVGNSLVNSPHKGQWRGALMFSLICAWINGWVNNREAGGLRRHRAHYDVTVMICIMTIWWSCIHVNWYKYINKITLTYFESLA